MLLLARVSAPTFSARLGPHHEARFLLRKLYSFPHRSSRISPVAFLSFPKPLLAPCRGSCTPNRSPLQDRRRRGTSSSFQNLGGTSGWSRSGASEGTGRGFGDGYGGISFAGRDSGYSSSLPVSQGDEANLYEEPPDPTAIYEEPPQVGAGGGRRGKWRPRGGRDPHASPWLWLVF